jgi:GDPmannose 4,6-dehydratase
MGSALILGVNGQDGYYLVRNLLNRQYSVCGIGRQAEPAFAPEAKEFSYYGADLQDAEALSRILKLVRPTHIFHVAAMHGPDGFLYETEWQQAAQVGLNCVHILLEYMRTESPQTALIYASSKKVFGTDPPMIIDETSPRVSQCLYTIVKNAAQDLIEYYRIQHGLKSTVLYFFNHESLRRSKHYFIPKVVESLVDSLNNPSHLTSVNSLDFYCDWGDADEYTDIAIDIAERGLGQNYVVATGRTWSGRELVDALFSQHGLDYREHIIPKSGELCLETSYSVCLDRLRQTIGRIPERSILDVCEDIYSARSS